MVESPRPQKLAVVLPLFLLGMAGIYFVARGVGDFVHGGSHAAGTRFIALGLLCYVGGIGIGRWMRRRRHR